MDENARLRLERNRAVQAAPAIQEDPAARLTAAAAVSQPRAPAEYSITQTRSAYPYTSGLKLESSTAALGSVTSLGYHSGAGY